MIDTLNYYFLGSLTDTILIAIILGPDNLVIKLCTRDIDIDAFVGSLRPITEFSRAIGVGPSNNAGRGILLKICKHLNVSYEISHFVVAHHTLSDHDTLFFYLILPVVDF